MRLHEAGTYGVGVVSLPSVETLVMDDQARSFLNTPPADFAGTVTFYYDILNGRGMGRRR